MNINLSSMLESYKLAFWCLNAVIRSFSFNKGQIGFIIVIECFILHTFFVCLVYPLLLLLFSLTLLFFYLTLLAVFTCNSNHFMLFANLFIQLFFRFILVFVTSDLYFLQNE